MDIARRRQIVEELTKPGNEFGFKITGQATDKWTTVFSATIHEWNEDEEPDKDQLLAEISAAITKLEKKMAGVQIALASALKGVK